MDHHLLFIFSFILFVNSLEAKKLTCNEVIKHEPSVNFEVKFYLYNYDKDDSFEINTRSIHINKILRQHKFDISQKTKLIIHGFLDSANRPWVKKMARKLKQMDRKTNVILVDWSQAFWTEYEVNAPNSVLKQLIDSVWMPTPNYRKAALGTETAAKEIRNTLFELYYGELHNLRHWGDLHFIGHSLGAHVAGQAARLMTQWVKSYSKMDVLVNRVTGLDPAQPCFESNDASLRLRREDAHFVDVIHTNSEPGENNHNFGIFEPIGHMDFYPNGGNNQDFCRTKEFHRQGKTWKMVLDYVLGYYNEIDTSNLTANFGKNIWMICNHLQAPELFIKSLTSNNDFLSNVPRITSKLHTKFNCENNKKCTKNTCVPMGINAEKYNHPNNHEIFYYTAEANCNSLS